MVFGFVLVGSWIDPAFAGLLSDAAKSEVVLVADQLLGSTFPASRLPWRSSKEWKSALSQTPGQQVINLEGENYLAQSLRLGSEGEGAPLAVIFQSRDRALAPYRRIQFGLAALCAFPAMG